VEVVATPPRTPLWRNVRFRRVLGQVLFMVLVLFLVREVSFNLQFNTAARRQGLGFGFLDSQAGFAISDTPIEYSSTNPVSRAFQVGFWNTIRVAGLGIVLTTILGLLLGIARLSPNWLVRKLSQGYVDLIRNTPVAVQVVFWWSAIFLALPRIQESVSIFDVAYVSNRSTVLPWFRLEEGGGIWMLSLAAGLLGAALLWRWRSHVNERTGEPHHRVLWSTSALLAVAALGFFVSGTPMEADVPHLLGRNYLGGVRLSSEFAALLIALVIYTAAFIAEIVRGSIQAISRGQHEAAEALGLRRGQQLRFVILPQALRIAIPAINSQYLNLMKNSSLGVLIGFYELTRVSKSIITGRGNNLQVLLMTMGVYLAISLTISLFMNLINRAVTTRGVR